MQIPKILIVDDERDVRVRLGNLISRRINCIVEKASNGKKALEKLKKDNFDLVFLDIKMPGLSGIDVVREAIKFTPQTKFLAITAYDSCEIADEVLKAGAVDYIHKPLTIEGMERRVKEILIQMGKYEPKKT